MLCPLWLNFDNAPSSERRIMRVAMYYNNNDIRMEELPKPQIGEGEILIRVEASGICSTDTLEWYHINKAPLVLGHEIAGVIVETGKGVEKYKEGDRITAAHHVPCGSCYYCRTGHETCCETLRSKTHFIPGGFSEYIQLPKINAEKGVFPFPDDLSFEEASFTEPLACVLRGQRIAHIKQGQAVLVIGNGIIGLLHIKLARLQIGAGRIMATDINPYRLGLAERFGADEAINAEEDIPGRFRQLNNGRLADLVIVCSGAVSAIKQALHSVEPGGTVLLFAPTANGITIPVSINELFFRNDITLTTSYAGSPLDYRDALELIVSNRIEVKDMITHRLGLSQTQLGFQLTAKAQESLKVIINPQKIN